LSYEDVKGRTSSSVGQGTEDGALFDETIAAYALRGKAAQELLSGALVESHNKAFRDYITKVHWTTIGEAAELGKSFHDEKRCGVVLTPDRRF
jgi:RAD50-interacting protein 1